MSAVSVLAGLVTRSWTLPASGDSRARTIALQHHTIAGSRQLTIDGSDVPGTLGSNSIVGGASVLTFDVDGNRGQVTIAKSGTKFTYSCVVDGEALVEANDLKSAAVSAGASLTINVEDGDLAMSTEGKPVVWYRVRTTPSDGSSPVVVHRRFREFHAVDDTLKSSYRGTALVSSFPKLPSRGVKLFTNHTSPQFIEQRRQALSMYLQSLARIPRMTTNPDFLVFLGTADDIVENSVMFDDGPLGLTLKGSRSGVHHYVEVTQFKPRPDGSPAAAEASGVVQIGDKVSKVNGEDALEVPYEVVVAKIKATPRPMVIHFLGYKRVGDRPADAAAGASASAGAGAGAGGFVAAPAPAVAVPAAAPTPAPVFTSAPAPAPAPAPPVTSSFSAAEPTEDDLDLL